MPDKVQALLRREERQRDRDQLDDLVERARARGAQEGLQLRKRLFDRIEVRTVGRQKAKPGADPFDRGVHFRLFVHREVEHAGRRGGLSFRAWDTVNLADQLQRLLTDDALVAELRASARPIAENFSVTNMTDRVLDHLGLPRAPSA